MSKLLFSGSWYFTFRIKDVKWLKIPEKARQSFLGCGVSMNTAYQLLGLLAKAKAKTYFFILAYNSVSRARDNIPCSKPCRFNSPPNRLEEPSSSATGEFLQSSSITGTKPSSIRTHAHQLRNRISMLLILHCWRRGGGGAGRIWLG